MHKYERVCTCYVICIYYFTFLYTGAFDAYQCPFTLIAPIDHKSRDAPTYLNP